MSTYGPVVLTARYSPSYEKLIELILCLGEGEDGEGELAYGPEAGDVLGGGYCLCRDPVLQVEQIHDGIYAARCKVSSTKVNLALGAYKGKHTFRGGPKPEQ